MFTMQERKKEALVRICLCGYSEFCRTMTSTSRPELNTEIFPPTGSYVYGHLSSPRTPLSALESPRIQFAHSDVYPREESIF
jgi:hypothetical protein